MASATAARDQGTVVCTIADPGALELSGLAIRDDILYLVGDGDKEASRRKVFRVKQDCTPAGPPLSFPAGPPAVDPEDITVDKDGILWIGDIGDNDRKRPHIALWRVGADNKIEGPYRYAYPDGAHDAEALLIGTGGLPIIVTKAVDGGRSRIYTATALATQKASNTPVALKLVGELTLPVTTTPHAVAAFRTMVTSAALSPKRDRVVLRTYTDAFEWTIAGDDITASILAGKPKATPLLQAHPTAAGEAITYSEDAKSFLTVNETWFLDEEIRKPAVYSYVPVVEVPVQASPVAADPVPKSGQSILGWATTSPSRIMTLIGSIGILGLLFVVAGSVGIIRSRKPKDDEQDDVVLADTATVVLPQYKRRKRKKRRKGRS